MIYENERKRISLKHELSCSYCGATDVDDDDVLFSYDRERGSETTQRDLITQTDGLARRPLLLPCQRRPPTPPELPPVLQLGFDNSLFGKWSMAAREKGRKEGRRDGETCFGEFAVASIYPFAVAPPPLLWFSSRKSRKSPRRSIHPASPSLLPHSLCSALHSSSSSPIPKLVLDISLSLDRIKIGV